MSEQELMRPRYKVIADYPASILYMDIGDILTQDTPSGVTGGKKGLNMSIETVKAYPHLFKKLEWWEERKEDDMPKYLKSEIHGTGVYRLYLVHGYRSNVYGEFYALTKNSETGNLFLRNADAIPATEQEYTDYINSLTK